MNILNDTEHRIFLSAMQREEDICKKEDDLEDSGVKLVPVCESIERKVNEAISLEAYKQVAKERDIAIDQLHELGYEFGEKIEATAKKPLDVQDTNVGNILTMIRGEIMWLYNDRPAEYCHQQRTEFLEGVLKIIDKYKQEGEE